MTKAALPDYQPISLIGRNAATGAGADAAIALFGQRLARSVRSLLADRWAFESFGSPKAARVDRGSLPTRWAGKACVARVIAGDSAEPTLVAVDLAIACAGVDGLYGGAGLVTRLGGAPRRSEQTLVLRLANALGRDLGDAAPAELLDGDGQSEALAAMHDPWRLAMSFGRAGKEIGSVELVFGGAAVGGENPGPAGQGCATRDAQWKRALAQAAEEIRLPLRTVVARPELPLSRILALKPGDVIPLVLPAQVPVTASGLLIGHAVVGDTGGRASIRFESLVENTHGLN